MLNIEKILKQSIKYITKCAKKTQEFVIEHDYYFQSKKTWIK